ncbi:hypothetical protein COLO4_36642 [Corchorus olitorius]|uniref:Uncharacterized protein n=1 Tax=Corchorus olitorius TaxID=93759 RepID=A0A1R3G728_9ROSI|nr:hypothetical protein COLO4_36642 [Corchorus olitorius]
MHGEPDEGPFTESVSSARVEVRWLELARIPSALPYDNFVF